MTRGAHLVTNRYFFTQWGTWQTFGFTLYEALRVKLFQRIQRHTLAMPRYRK